jgi:hypothetical protein
LTQYEKSAYIVADKSNSGIARETFVPRQMTSEVGSIQTMLDEAPFPVPEDICSDPNLERIQEILDRVILSHKTHEKAREIESSKATCVKWSNITLTTLTCSSIVTTLIVNQRVLLYIGTLLSACTLVFVIFQLTFDPAKGAELQRAAAKQLWYIREKVRNLIVDLRVDPASTDISRRRDELIGELKRIYEVAPDTSSAAYRKAQAVLKAKRWGLSDALREATGRVRELALGAHHPSQT